MIPIDFSLPMLAATIILLVGGVVCWWPQIKHFIRMVFE